MRQPKKECACESTRENLDFLNEAVFWVAKDVIEHEKVLDLYAERIYSTEEACFWVDWKWGFKKAIETIKKDQITDAENLSNAIDIMINLQKADKMILDIIIRQNKTIGLLSDEVNKLYNGIIFLTIWSVVITILTAVIIFNVFF